MVLSTIVNECKMLTEEQFYTAIAPPGTSELNGVEGFFKSYLALPVVILFWVGGFAWKRTGWLRTSQMDVDTGRRELDWDEIHAYRAKIAAMPAWRRAIDHVW